MTDYYTDQSIYVMKRKKRNVMLPIIILIVIVTIIMPIYGTTLRYQVSVSIRLVCDYLGNIFQQFGWLFLMITAIQAFFGKVKLKWMITGILLLYVGAFLTGGTVTILGMTIYEPISNPGFH